MNPWKPLRWYERVLVRIPWWRAQQLGLRLALRRVWSQGRPLSDIRADRGGK